MPIDSRLGLTLGWAVRRPTEGLLISNGVKLEVTVQIPSGAGSGTVLGGQERNLKLLREATGVRVSARDGTVKLAGEAAQVAAAQRVLERLRELASGGKSASTALTLDIIAEEIAKQESRSREQLSSEPWDGRLDVYASGRPVKPRTPNQQVYLEAVASKRRAFPTCGRALMHSTT